MRIEKFRDNKNNNKYKKIMHEIENEAYAMHINV